MHRGGNAIFRLARFCVRFIAAQFQWDRHSCLSTCAVAISCWTGKSACPTENKFRPIAV
jgi:hypothetical protein